MDELFTWIIVAAVLSAVGGAVFWGLIGWGVFKILDSVPTAHPARAPTLSRALRGSLSLGVLVTFGRAC